MSVFPVMFRNSRHLEKPPSAMVIAAPLVPAKALFRCQPSMPLASAMIAASPANQPSTRKKTQQTAYTSDESNLARVCSRLCAKSLACAVAHLSSAPCTARLSPMAAGQQLHGNC